MSLNTLHTVHLGHLTGTDLGVSYVEPGRTNRLIFLFGNSWTPNPAAWTLPFVIPNRNLALHRRNFVHDFRSIRKKLGEHAWMIDTVVGVSYRFRH